MKRIVFVLLLIVTLSSCKLKESIYVDNYYAPVDNVTIISIGQSLPDNVVRVGSISVGESGSTPTEKCTYQACMNAITLAAKKNGVHIVHIVSIREPYSGFFGSTCYDITADFYRYKN